MRNNSFSQYQQIPLYLKREPLKLTVIVPIEHPFIPPRNPVDNLSRELTSASTD